MNKPSFEKKVLAPPHLLSIAIVSGAARYEPDCRKTVLPVSGHVITSPTSAGATITRASAPVAVKVLRKNDSPPRTERLRPFIIPPLVLVEICTLGVIANIAPASADTDSPWCRWIVAAAYAGL